MSQHSIISDTTTGSLSVTDNVNELKKKTEALERLKREQKLVKEQLERLTRERNKATTDNEFDVLSQNSLSSSSSTKSSSSKTTHEPIKTSNNEQNNANSINMKRVANLNLNCNSPNLSPISPENVFQDTRS